MATRRLFLLLVNDLLVRGTFGYADDSTVADRYLASANARKGCYRVLSRGMVNRLNVALQTVSDWGDANLVPFKATKTFTLLFSIQRNRIHLPPAFRGVSVPLIDNLQVLGVELSSNLCFGQTPSPKRKLT